MAFPAADAPAPTQTPGALARWWARLVAALEAYPVERIGLAALAAGVVLRLAAPFFMDFRSDGDTYVAMGQPWMVHHLFLLPIGDETSWVPPAPQFSKHCPP